MINEKELICAWSGQSDDRPEFDGNKLNIVSRLEECLESNVEMFKLYNRLNLTCYSDESRKMGKVIIKLRKIKK